MNIEEIVESLTTFNSKYPLAAMKAASRYQEEITPILLNALDEAFKEKENLDGDCMLHVFGMFLLAQFKEVRAFPKLVKFLEMKEEAIDAVIGGTLTEDYHNILCSTFNGDLQLLKNIIENDDIFEYARGAALNASVGLVATGQIEANDWQLYLKTLLEQPNDEMLKAQIVNVIISARFYDLIPTVKETFLSETISTDYTDYASFVSAIFSVESGNPNYVVEDAIAQTRNWHCFEKDEVEGSTVKKNDFDFDLKKLQQAMYPTETLKSPKIGRNDPCSCGSGKKYKKCCLNQPTENVFTPYEQAILQFYPQESSKFYEYFDNDAIAFDRIVCIAMRKPIPIYPAPQSEKIDTRFKNLKKAYKLFLSKMEEENFTTLLEFDEKYYVHYHAGEWLEMFERLLSDYEQEELIAELPSISQTLQKYKK